MLRIREIVASSAFRLEKTGVEFRRDRRNAGRTITWRRLQRYRRVHYEIIYDQ